MKKSGSIYFKLVLVGLVGFLPAAFWILKIENDRLNHLLDRQLKTQLEQLSIQIASSSASPVEVSLRFQADVPPILERFNRLEDSVRITQAGLYEKSSDKPEFQLTQHQQIDNKLPVPFKTNIGIKSADFLKLRRIGPDHFRFMFPIPSAGFQEKILVLSALSEGRQAYVHDALTQQGLYLAALFCLILALMGLLIRSEIKVPLGDLVSSFSSKRKSALDPDSFGELSELVQTLDDFRHGCEESRSSAVAPDARMDLAGDTAAQKIYESARAASEETYAVFFKVNFAKEYIKAFGRANRGVIKKISAGVIRSVLSKPDSLAYTEDFFFVSVLKPKEFRPVLARAQKIFNEKILCLYELGQGKQVNIQTLSAFAISSHAPSVDTYTEALDLVLDQWPSRIDRPRGGWAILDGDGQIQQSERPAEMPEPPQKSAGAFLSSAAVNPSEGGPEPANAASKSGESDMDPVLARKMFIVKLCRLAGVKPRLAAQVYSAGWHRPDLLLQTKIQEISSKAGVDPQEASDLIGSLRKIPPEKLAYSREDYREVFVTDVRMIRKIPKETLFRWFDAGFGRVEDLRKAKSDDLLKLDEAVSKEDIEAVLAAVQSVAS